MNTTAELIEEALSKIPSEVRNTLIPYHVGQPILGRITLQELLKSEMINSAQAAREEERREILERLPREFWEDEDHAVGGYISKKDLKQILSNQ